MTYQIEVSRKVFDNEHGTFIKVGQDADGLLLEIDGGDDYGRLALPPQHALVLAEAITAAAKEMIG